MGFLGPPGGKPCYYYCTNLDFSSLNQGTNACQVYLNDGEGPYNFASLYSTYELEVSSTFDDSPETGVDLSQATGIELGLWIKTYGERLQGGGGANQCSQIQSLGNPC